MLIITLIMTKIAITKITNDHAEIRDFITIQYHRKEEILGQFVKEKLNRRLISGDTVSVSTSCKTRAGSRLKFLVRFAICHMSHVSCDM